MRRATADELLVYPVFMSDGYFVRHVLAQRVAAAAGPSARTLAPLGLDPSLPPLMMREALAAAARAAFDAGSARLLVVGHGSSSRPNGASARATRRAAQLLAMTRTFADISVAFLEEPPFLTDCLADGSRPTVVLGFFSGRVCTPSRMSRPRLPNGPRMPSTPDRSAPSRRSPTSSRAPSMRRRRRRPELRRRVAGGPHATRRMHKATFCARAADTRVPYPSRSAR